MQSENSSNNTNFDNDEISLKELIFKIREWYQFLLTKWKLIIVISAIGGAIGLTYAFFQKPIYKADLTFAMEDEKSGGGGLSGALGLASSFGIDLGGGGAGGAGLAASANPCTGNGGNGSNGGLYGAGGGGGGATASTTAGSGSGAGSSASACLCIVVEFY